MSEAKRGYVIQVGDVLIHKTNLGSKRYIVHRVTPKRAYVRFNDHRAEGVFRREIGSLDYAKPVPEQHIWDSSRWICIPQPTGDR